MRRHPRTPHVLALVLLLLAGSLPGAAASRRQELRQCLDRTRSAEGVPGALLSTARHNLRSGVSDVETGALIRPQDRFRIGSNTKTFVATVVLQLVGEGKLGLEDRLDTLLGAEVAGVPHADKITVRRLLNMTSGIYNYNDAEFLAAWYKDPAKVWTPQEIIGSIAGKTPYFEPGATCAECPGLCAPGPNSQCWYYSNTNYILLGRIIEKVTGRPLEKELRSRIFEPLRLRDTSFATRQEIPAPHSHGYMTAEFGGEPVEADCPPADGGELYDATSCFSPTAAWAAGAIVSSVFDLRTWLAALVDGRLLPRALQRERLTFVPGSLGGIPIEYGLGIMRFNDAVLGFPGTGQSFLGHGGAFQGFGSVMMQGVECRNQIIGAVNLFPQSDPSASAYFSLFAIADAVLCHDLPCPTPLAVELLKLRVRPGEALQTQWMGGTGTVKNPAP